MEPQYLELFKQLIRLKTTHEPQHMPEHDRCRDLLTAEAHKRGLKTRLISSDPYPSLIVGLDVDALEPDLSGFWAKMILIKASLDVGRYGLAIAAAVVGLLTIYSMTKIWNEAFWKPGAPSEANEMAQKNRFSPWMIAPVAAMAALTVFIGIFPEPVYQLARAAAEELLDPGAYVYTVIGKFP